MGFNKQGYESKLRSLKFGKACLAFYTCAASMSRIGT